MKKFTDKINESKEEFDSKQLGEMLDYYTRLNKMEKDSE